MGPKLAGVCGQHIIEVIAAWTININKFISSYQLFSVNPRKCDMEMV